MSFQRVPSLCRIPDCDEQYLASSIWKGLGTDSGYYSFYTNYNAGSYVIVREENMCFSLEVGSDRLRPQYSEINGHMWWSGYGYFYWSIRFGGWVYTRDYSLYPGYEPKETLWADEDEWPGNDFYFISRIPDMGREDEMYGRGSNWDSDATLTIKRVWPRWASKDRREYGEFVGTDGESGSRFIGIPRYRSNKWEYFDRSFAKVGGYYTYGRIHYEEGKWVIGTIGSDSGWFEGDEPNMTNAVTFKFCKNEDSEIEDQDDLTIQYYLHVVGDQASMAFLGSVAVWR